MALLIDPDKADKHYFEQLLEHFSLIRPDMFFVGGSIMEKTTFDTVVSQTKQLFPDIPLILFPGNQYQVSDAADAILMLSLVSGRNPEYLIGQQVAAAPFIEKTGLETLPTAYLMIDGGKITSGNYITQTTPVPADKPEIAAITALAAKQLGMQYIYLEAGSGAKHAVSPEMIKAVKSKTQLPLIVGGGLRDATAVKTVCQAGADVLVIGTLFEESPQKLAEIRTAIELFAQTQKVT